MKRVAVILLGVVMLALMPTIGCAQGLFGGLPGLPSFGGLTGGSSGCGEKLCPSSNLEFYIGWMEDRDGTSINVDAEGVGAALVPGLINVNSVRHHYSNRGLWLGLSDTICISDRLSFIASGWYLVPASTSSREEYGLGVNQEQRGGLFGADRSWHTKPQWWYVDGIFAIGSPCGGFALLAGLRYDYYTARFENPYNLGVGALTDEADVTSEGWIPLVGTQYALSSSMGSLVVRAVGVPSLLGTARYKQTIGGVERVEAKGNWNGRGFLEVFAEYSKSFGPGAMGVFGRWNMAQGNADLDLSILPFPGSQTYKLALHRNSWTFGASFSLNFNMPFM
jgi:hypothetical protein